jgi:DNA-binding IclR family transcriptional regulator
VVACLVEHPGSSVKQLARHLGIDSSKIIRAVINSLVNEGTIRCEERAFSIGVTAFRTYSVARRPATPLEHSSPDRDALPLADGDPHGGPEARATAMGAGTAALAQCTG